MIDPHKQITVPFKSNGKQIEASLRQVVYYWFYAEYMREEATKLTDAWIEKFLEENKYRVVEGYFTQQFVHGEG